MRSKTIFGALLVSVALCSQGFGFELLERMLGLNGGGCGECNACAKVACCEKACEKACCPEPACCEKACGTCEKADAVFRKRVSKPDGERRRLLVRERQQDVGVEEEVHRPSKSAKTWSGSGSLKSSGTRNAPRSRP